MCRISLILAQGIRRTGTCPGHKELSPLSTFPDDGDDETSQLLREIRREKRAYQMLLSETRASHRRMRERLASLWPGALDE
jgi:hypothetical protein